LSIGVVAGHTELLVRHARPLPTSGESGVVDPLGFGVFAVFVVGVDSLESKGPLL